MPTFISVVAVFKSILNHIYDKNLNLKAIPSKKLKPKVSKISNFCINFFLNRIQI